MLFDPHKNENINSPETFTVLFVNYANPGSSVNGVVYKNQATKTTINMHNLDPRNIRNSRTLNKFDSNLVCAVE